MLAIPLSLLLHGAVANILRNPGFESVSREAPTEWCEDPCSLSADSSVMHSGSYSALAARRLFSWHGPAQLIGSGHAGKRYRTSGYFRLANAPAGTSAKIEIMISYQLNGTTQYDVLASATCSPDTWTQAINVYDFPADASGTFRLYIQSEYQVQPYYDFYSDDIVMVETPISLDWKAAANAEIKNHRKRQVTLVMQNPPTATFGGQITQQESAFPFGCTLNMNIDDNIQYRDTFFEHFNMAVIENDMKWSVNERNRDQLDYSSADTILSYLAARNVPCRAHTLFWAVDEFVQNWVKNLSPTELLKEMKERVSDCINHFKGHVVSWDVNNEMLHGRFYRDALQNDSVPSWMFKEVRKYDTQVPLFLNDYNVVTNGAGLETLIQQAAIIGAEGGDVNGIGAQGHFSGVIPSYDLLRFRLDRLASTGLDIWISELDVLEPDAAIRADKLELVVRTAFSHPAVKGVLLWGFWADSHWRGADAALWNSDWSPNAAGLRWQQLMSEWKTQLGFTESDLHRKADGSASLIFSGFFGNYTLSVNGASHAFSVPSGSGDLTVTVDLQMSPTRKPASSTSSSPQISLVSLDVLLGYCFIYSVWILP